MKKWKTFDFGSDDGNFGERGNRSSNKKNIKVIRMKDVTIKENKTISKTRVKWNFHFHLELHPKAPIDLAVHPKKIKEVEDWLSFHVISPQHKLQQHTPYLLISGPTGSGKTSTVNVLCKLLNITLSEWVNPVDQDFEQFKGPNQITRFMEFLTETKWNSLFESNNCRKVVLVKDFPNAVLRCPDEFYAILEECYYKIGNPIIFICTDAGHMNVNLVHALFPQEIKDKYNIKHVSFNACATNLMKSAIKRAQTLVQKHSDLFKLPSAKTIDAILASSMGDIRSAINQFYLASLLGSEDLPTVTENKPRSCSSKRKRPDCGSQIKCMLRDETLGLFHGLGRVLNPKRMDVGTSWRLSCDVGKLVDEFSIQPQNFVAFLFENYLKYFGDISDAARATDILSVSQTFLESWTDRHETLMFAVWLSVLGLMIFNEHKVSKWNQIRGPRKIITRAENSLDTKSLSSTDYFYYNRIKKSDKFHKFVC